MAYLGPISWGVLATIDSAWRPYWSSSARASYTMRCRFTRLCPSNFGDTTLRLKCVSPSMGLKFSGSGWSVGFGFARFGESFGLSVIGFVGLGSGEGRRLRWGFGVKGRVGSIGSIGLLGLGLGSGREGVGVKGRPLKAEMTLRERSMVGTITMMKMMMTMMSLHQMKMIFQRWKKLGGRGKKSGERIWSKESKRILGGSMITAVALWVVDESYEEERERVFWV
ncbi:unnamed protein product [Prunus armeniaca]|uniref:Uncharacterized protein n=1 Tax=Prunus armeniaca TaxID=36596 RepID=A0A6J5TGE2_PRUAR|nr:unnamed protein product [Prunus armeniaca]